MENCGKNIFTLLAIIILIIIIISGHHPLENAKTAVPRAASMLSMTRMMGSWNWNALEQTNHGTHDSVLILLCKVCNWTCMIPVGPAGIRQRWHHCAQQKQQQHRYDDE
jgi:hypothetical protein